MSEYVYELIFVLGWISIWVIRFPYIGQSLKTKGTEYSSGGFDKVLVGFLLLGTAVIPILYIFTPWLEFADYTLPQPISVLCIAIAVLSLVILRKAHVDLGRNYSQDLEIKDHHVLVAGGIYQYVRHPMYLAGFLFSLSQIGLLQNWIAGFSGVIGLTVFYLLRMPVEEEMMDKEFGQDYQSYKSRTKGLVPFI